MKPGFFTEMESVESPLDVLSRAATMVQDSQSNNTGQSILFVDTKMLHYNLAISKFVCLNFYALVLSTGAYKQGNIFISKYQRNFCLIIFYFC